MVSAAAVLRAWEAVIKHLQALSSDDLPVLYGPKPGVVMNAGAATLVEIAVQGVGVQGNKKSFGKLLAHKVPLRLATACYNILSRLYDSSGSSSRSSNRVSSSAPPPGGAIRPGQVVINQRSNALKALEALLLVATSADVLPGTSTPVHVPRKQASILAEQMNQSGLLQMLPAVIVAVADQLEAHLGTQQHSSQHTQSVVPNQPPVGPTGALLSRSGDAGSSSILETYPGTALPYLGGSVEGELVSVWFVIDFLCDCWPKHQLLQQVAPGCAAPLMRLAALTFQHISRELTSEQQTPKRLSTLNALLALAHSVARAVVSSEVAGLKTSDKNTLEQRVQVLVQSASSYLPCLALMVTYHVYMSLLLQLSALPSDSSTTTTVGGSSTSVHSTNVHSSSSSSSSSSIPTLGVQSWEDPVQAWQVACSQYQLLPASHHHLLQMLGCNGRAMLWVAAATAGLQVTPFTQDKHDQAVRTVHHYVSRLSMLYFTIDSISDCEQEQQQAASDAAGPAPYCGRANSLLKGTTRQLDVLLPAVLLLLPAYLPINHKADWLRDCFWAVQSIGGWAGLPQVLSSSPASVAQSSSSAHVDQKLSAVREVDLMIPDLSLPALQTSSKLLQLLNAPGSNDSDTTPVHQKKWDMVSWLPTLVAALVVVLVESGDSCSVYMQNQSQQLEQPPPTAGSSQSDTVAGSTVTCSTLSSSSSSSSSRAPSDAAATLVQHAVVVGELMEAYLRTMGGGCSSDENHDLAYFLKSLCLNNRLSEGQSSHDPSSGHAKDPLHAAALAAGPGSPQQQQLFCVLISLLKVLQSSAVSPNNSSTAGSIDSTARQHGCCTLALRLVAVMLESCLVTAAATTLAAKTSTLPWLVLLGRCCLYVSAQTSSSQSSGSIASTADGSSSTGTKAELPVQGTAEDDAAVKQLMMLFAACALALKAADSWLQTTNSTGTVSAQLAAAGYITEDLHSQIQQVVAALMPTAAAGGAEQAASGTAAATTGAGPAPACLRLLNSSLLTSLGLAFNSLPIPSACNNPSCGNLSGLSELQLVNGRTCMCSKCRVAHYCSRACQRQHWKQHKPACKALHAASL